MNPNQFLLLHVGYWQHYISWIDCWCAFIFMRRILIPCSGTCWNNDNDASNKFWIRFGKLLNSSDGKVRYIIYLTIILNAMNMIGCIGRIVSRNFSHANCKINASQKYCLELRERNCAESGRSRDWAWRRDSSKLEIRGVHSSLGPAYFSAIITYYIN